MNEDRLNAFVNQLVNDMAVSMSGVMTSIGHRLGLYKAMAGAGSITPSQLAQKTGTRERYILEWLNSQAASGYITYDPKQRTYELPDEHAMVLANTESPVFMAAAFDSISSMWLDEDKVINAFQTGRGIRCQAGFIRENGFVFLLFVILYFHWGFHITPYADTAMGLFDISRVIHALQRGAACNVDFSDHWNFWEVVDVPVEELRDCAERTALWAIATPFHPLGNFRFSIPDFGNIYVEQTQTNQSASSLQKL